MNQKGYTILELLIVIVVMCVVGAVSLNTYKQQCEKKAENFEVVFGIDLKPHMTGIMTGVFQQLDPEAKEIIQIVVTKKIIELHGEYYKIYVERQKLKEISPSEYGSAIRQLERLKELDSLMAKKWGPYMRAKKVAEWWNFDVDLPELPDQ